MQKRNLTRLVKQIAGLDRQSNCEGEVVLFRGRNSSTDVFCLPPLFYCTGTRGKGGRWIYLNFQWFSIKFVLIYNCITIYKIIVYEEWWFYVIIQITCIIFNDVFFFFCSPLFFFYLPISFPVMEWWTKKKRKAMTSRHWTGVGLTWVGMLVTCVSAKFPYINVPYSRALATGRHEVVFLVIHGLFSFYSCRFVYLKYKWHNAERIRAPVI